jgi:hypothetical protein
MEPTRFQLAKELWSGEAIGLAPTEFQSRFDAICETTADIEVLWQLGGAVNDYLRAHPNSVAVPPDLPFKLLASDHVQRRIVGLKLLHRLGAPLPQLLSHICSALQSQTQDELYGGLFVLGELLRHSPPNLSNNWNEVQMNIELLRQSADPYVRSTSERFSSWLKASGQT